jgi:hypothetical protein
MSMSDEDARQARLLAYYEQKKRESLERAEELRSALPGIPDEAKRKRTTMEVTRLTNLVDEYRDKAEQLRSGGTR